MKRLLKKIFRKGVKPIVDNVEMTLGRKCVVNESVAQRVLWMKYRELARQGRNSLPSFADAGFRKYSQFEEDGILLLIFAAIGAESRVCVELCAGNGRECMSTNLIGNHGWTGHLFDGDARNVENGTEFFRKSPDTFIYPPAFTKAWITAENVNELVRKSGASGAVDLLSLDLDGIDYWIWEALDVIQPRVVVCETHNLIPPNEALTVPYSPDFQCKDERFRSASLAAMCSLGKKKGYRLVGTHRFGFNAFFMLQGVAEDLFPEVGIEECVSNAYSKSMRSQHWDAIKDLGWVRVG